MALTKTIVVEGLKDNGIPIGEIGKFVDAVYSAGSGVHALVQVSVDKVRGGDDLIRLSLEVVTDLADTTE